MKCKRCRVVFLRLSGTADHYIGGRRTRGPLILTTAANSMQLLSSVNMGKITVKVVINLFLNLPI
jgi:hypothetical protein